MKLYRGLVGLILLYLLLWEPSFYYNKKITKIIRYRYFFLETPSTKIDIKLKTVDSLSNFIKIEKIKSFKELPKDPYTKKIIITDGFFNFYNILKDSNIYFYPIGIPLDIDSIITKIKINLKKNNKKIIINKDTLLIKNININKKRISIFIEKPNFNTRAFIFLLKEVSPVNITYTKKIKHADIIIGKNSLISKYRKNQRKVIFYIPYNKDTLYIKDKKNLIVFSSSLYKKLLKSKLIGKKEPFIEKLKDYLIIFTYPINITIIEGKIFAIFYSNNADISLVFYNHNNIYKNNEIYFVNKFNTDTVYFNVYYKNFLVSSEKYVLEDKNQENKNIYSNTSFFKNIEDKIIRDIYSTKNYKKKIIINQTINLKLYNNIFILLTILILLSFIWIKERNNG